MVKDTISLETSLLESKPFVCWHAPKMVRLLLPRDWSPLLMVVAVEKLCFHFFLWHILSESLYSVKAWYFDKNAFYRQIYFTTSH